MLSVIFPGQGSQSVGMARDLHEKYKLVQDIFQEADETLNSSDTDNQSYTCFLVPG